jgi:general secretion pathway protein H
MRRAERAFTLLEMTVVLLIIAVGTALVAPMIEGGMEAREVRRAARQIAATMHYCRGEAVALGKPQELVIDAFKNSIQTSGGRWATLTDRAAIERVEGGFAPAEGVTQMLFYPNGATTGGDVLVVSRRDHTRNRIAIHLDPLVGLVTVRDATL